MFKVNGFPLLADEFTVIETLKTDLERHGIHLFNHIKQVGNNIQCTCPIHNNGQERRPSCGISIVDQGEVPAGTVHCFTCGYTATLEEMISNCFGYNDFGSYGRQWLTRNFLSVSVEERKPLELDLGRNIQQKSVQYVTEEELETYRFYHPYMYKRKLTDEVIEKFDVGYDKAFKLNDDAPNTLRCITFPVRDSSGNVLFIARRCIDYKLFHYPEGVDKPIYGLYELPDNVDEVIVCESIINALTCYVYGKPAVALLGTGTTSQYEQLKRLPCRKLITALDPDNAGRKGTQRLKEAVGNYKLVTSYVLPDGKDINDLEQEEFEELMEVF